MKAKLVSFGEIDIDGERYDYDIVIEQGKVQKRKKKPSKPYRERYGHTPLSAAEHIPWHGKTLYIGTGAYGSLPVMKDVYAEAEKKGVKVVVKKTNEVGKLFAKLQPKDINAILHITC